MGMGVVKIKNGADPVAIGNTSRWISTSTRQTMHTLVMTRSTCRASSSMSSAPRRSY